MDVITKYPIVTTTSAAQTKSEYRRSYDAFDGIFTSPMVVDTKYPIVVTNSPEQTEEQYRSTYSGADGENAMVVTTAYPIVYTDSDKASEDEYRGTYSGFLGLGGTREQRSARRLLRKEKRQKRRKKIGEGLKKFAQSGVGQAILGGIGQPTPPIDGSVYDTSFDVQGGKKPMSTGAKIALIGGGLLVVGVIVYFVMKNNKAVKK